MTPVPKMILALRNLNRRLGIDWELSRLVKAEGRPLCRVRLDRLVVTASGIAEELIRRLPGFRRTKKHFLRRRHPKDFLAYGRVTVFEGTTSIRQLIVLSDRKMRRLPYCKVTLIARDETGLEPRDVLSVFGLIADPKLVLVELAFDYGFGSGVTGAYVRQHALFGKSKPCNVATIRGYDSWGTRKGPKFVRSYYK
jgi:hypothetical protein